MDRKYTTEQQIEEMREKIKNEKQKMKKNSSKKDNIINSSEPVKVKRHKIMSTIIFSFAVLFLSSILISVLVARTQGNTPDIFGYHLYVIESGSMEPNLEVGNVIISRKPKESASLSVDDIVTFKTTQGFTVTHRIVEVVSDDTGNISYKTKGDNPINSIDREHLTPDRVISVMIAKVPLT